MKKTVLITGGTKGIGLAITDLLKDEYEVITVARGESAIEPGDLTDRVFRDYLVNKYTPDIFINNAAGLFQDPYKMLEMNGSVPIELLLRFYEKMSKGIIINVGSQSGERHVRPKEQLNRTLYALGKRFLKDASLVLNYSKNKPIKVMCISPNATHTSLLKNITNFTPSKNDYENFDWNKSIAWTKPEEVADIVKWLIDLPPHICIPEIVLDNHYSNVVYW
jgi:NADP-dependent 3-hydroxy acid dehydrogenase YdfG